MRVTDEGIELEADPRHAELVIKELGLIGAKESLVPGSKADAKPEVSTTADSAKGRSRASQARMEVENVIASIESARQSAGGEAWEHGSAEDLVIDDQDVDLDAVGAQLYRGVAARLNYIAPDRPDIAYAVKESARNMSRPRANDMKNLLNIGRYLTGKPRLVSEFVWQDAPDRATAFTDSDWAGCAKSAKSTSGGAVCLGEHVVKT